MNWTLIFMEMTVDSRNLLQLFRHHHIQQYCFVIKTEVFRFCKTTYSKDFKGASNMNSLKNTWQRMYFMHLFRKLNLGAAHSVLQCCHAVSLYTPYWLVRISHQIGKEQYNWKIKGADLPLLLHSWLLISKVIQWAVTITANKSPPEHNLFSFSNLVDTAEHCVLKQSDTFSFHRSFLWWMLEAVILCQ